MSSQSPKEMEPVSFPGTFSADNGYRLGAVGFSAIGLVSLGLSAMHHEPKMILETALPFLAFTLIAAVILTLRLEVNDSGLRQGSALGQRAGTWDQVQRVELSQTYAVYGADNRELVWLSLFPMRVQQAVANEAIRQAKLRPSGSKPQRPITAIWVR